MLKNALGDIANRRTKRQSNKTMFQVLAKSPYQERENYDHKIVLKCWYVATIGRPDILWSVNNLARSVRKWTGVCDRRLARLISYVHRTSDYRQYCHVGTTAQHCRSGLFQDSDIAGDLEHSKSTSSGVLCVVGSRTFVLFRWMCRKQTS